MTSNIDLVKEFIEKGWSNPPASVIEANMTYLSDDFGSLDKNGNVQMDKAARIGMVQMLMVAFKDMRWVLKDLRAEGDSVIMTGHFQGTHTGEVDLSAMGIGVVPASGKWIVWPETSVEYKVCLLYTSDAADE